MRGTRRRRNSGANSKQEGYALLMAIFMVATIIIMATAITPSILTDGRRQREQEVIWRGNQYVRAIQLYYKKNGRYPQTADDLTKGSLSVHFLRKDYADPMNSPDGSWRFIYVSPAGQLIGSVRYHNLQEMALMQKLPGAGQALNLTGTSGQQGANGQANAQNPSQPGPGAPIGANGANGGTGQQGGSAGQQGNPGAGAPTGQPGQPTQPDQGFAPTAGAFASSFGQNGSGGAGGAGGSSFGSGFGTPVASNVPLEAVDGPVLGAFLIGVASKVKKPSLMVYQGGKTYFEWEFIYNPLSVVSVNGQATPGAGVPGLGGQLGTNGAAVGSTSGFSTTPSGNSPQGMPLGLPPLK